MPDESTVNVSFGMEQSYIYSVLTSDISVADAILDLIDNSIDAARKDIQHKGGAQKGQHLPSSYAGYTINLSIDESGIAIQDNCHGIEEGLLTEKAFKLGARHEQNFSIGMYGVGLVRAYWKLGRSLEMVTDNTKNKFSLQVDRDKVLKAEHPVVPAAKSVSSGTASNIVCINELHSETLKDVSSTYWQEKFFQRVSRIFGLCISKGLQITINKVTVPEFGPEIREEIKPLLAGQTFHTDDGVKIRIKVGAHQDYIFPGEPGHNARKNSKYTKEFGWYVVCNDRIVMTAARTEAVGWTSEWHSEYNGFLGWAYLECSDAKKLPWNSKKTDLILDHEVQRVLAVSLNEFSDRYRSINSEWRYDDGEKKPQKPKAEPEAKKEDMRAKKSTPPSKPSKPRKGKKPDHTKDDYFVLLPCEVYSSNPRVKDLVHEAHTLLIYEAPYASALLLRACAETIVTDFLKRKGHYQAHLDDHWGAIDELRASETPPRPALTARQRGDRTPTFRDSLDWVNAHPEVFEDKERREAMRSLQHFLSDLKVLNGITHENATISDSEIIRTFRNRVFPLINVMLQ
jgi:hypothetical protein